MWRSAEPTRLLEVSGGGRPVFTAAELSQQQSAKAPAGSAVAPAAFEQPLEEPRPLKVFGQWTEQEAAALALGRIGESAIPDLVEALSSPDATVRRKAVEVLGRMGGDSAPAVPELVKLLDDPDVAVRKAAIRTLGQIGPAAKEAVPALVQTLLEPAPRSPQ